MIAASGMKWPFRFSNGRVATSNGERHIKESLMQIIGIGKNEYLMKPNFGADLRRRVFDPINVAALVEGDISAAIRQFEPRVDLLRISTNQDGGQSAMQPGLQVLPGISIAELGILNIEVAFRIKGRNEPVMVTVAIGR